MQRRIRWIWLALAALATLLGCEPTVSREELGQIVYEMPAVPGAERPYELPDLNAPAEPTVPDAAAADSVPEQ